ncbi:unnamed protein product [Parnassius mnemosyne]|uniref:Peptidase S1 domain-containing protein n=1 Tax=Parnassius mnemosyne TaxID=213953 RepID=A0AAV1L7G6_9NEOP
MHIIISFYFLVFNSFTYLTCESIDNDDSENLSANSIAETLIKVVGADLESSRITELKEKLKKIDSYVVDKNKYTDLLKNITTETDLNQTNFFTALYERDDFKFLLNNETKNVYLKLKQNMNRDDIIKILAEKANTSKLLTRKTIGLDYMNRFGDDGESDPMLDTIVDELIAESPKDKHRYDFKDNENIYWDPQGELEDLKEYHQHDGRRIFKGERTTIKNYPFMVSVHVMGRFWCGGALYWHDLVLTSAACLQLMHNNRFFRENPKVLQVRIGSNHSRIGGEMVDALEVYFHPSYNPRTLRNNIAVIRLRYHLFFTYHRTPKIIAISHNPGGIPNTAEVLLLGWGVKKLSQKMSYEPVFLQRKILPVYPNVFCKEVYGDKFISSTMFCAGTITTGEGACAHDAGGPAIVAGKLVGIISFGPTICGFPNAPTVFTLVGAFADWIETINETMPSYYVGKKRTTTLIPYSQLEHFDFTRFHRTTIADTVTTSAAFLRQNNPTTSPGSLRNKKLRLINYTFGDDKSLE